MATNEIPRPTSAPQKPPLPRDLAASATAPKLRRGMEQIGRRNSLPEARNLSPNCGRVRKQEGA
ncbi:MAG: hypothetical protein KBA97_06660 [Methanothrix sp.]|nr:hypothetical protein [Methanothrix sp.]